MKVLITTSPFGSIDERPLNLLEAAGIEHTINPFGRKIREAELAELVTDCDAIIAGTEQIGSHIMDLAPRLKLISRVGVGLDGVDLLGARERNISVAYTPAAPAPAVAELTVGLMISLLRNAHIANAKMHSGVWERVLGRRISDVTIGIIGAGRIGSGVIDRLESFGPAKVLVNDVRDLRNLKKRSWLEFASRDDVLACSDVVSLHVPLTSRTRGILGYAEMKKMKPDACLINTARGGIINESDLKKILREGYFSGVAVDVFETEPYQGDLIAEPRCLLTAHMGSMSRDCRAQMELEATEQVIEFLMGRPLITPVPDDEYSMRMVEMSGG